MGRRTYAIDWVITILLALLALFGLFVLSTIDQSVFLQQSIFFILAVIVFVFASRLDHLLIEWIAPFGYIGSLIFLAFSYLGPNIRGARRWIMFGPVQIQPSEVLKPFFMVAFAYFISKYPPRNLKYVPMHMGLFILPFLLVFKQPDLGTSIVYVSFWLAMMIAGGLPLRYIFIVILCAAVLTPTAWHFLAGYQKDRLITFFDPAHDPKGVGYNALQATIAVGSGQLFGKGLGQGTQSHLRFLPEFHTDFIFATLVEELGFVGGILLFVLYGMLLWRLLAMSFRLANHPIGFIYLLGLFFMIATQVFVNAGMNMGIVPITGITLPFVSAGGSSLVGLSLAFGIGNAFLFAGTRQVHGVAIGE